MFRWPTNLKVGSMYERELIIADSEIVASMDEELLLMGSPSDRIPPLQKIGEKSVD